MSRLEDAVGQVSRRGTNEQITAAGGSAVLSVSSAQMVKVYALITLEFPIRLETQGVRSEQGRLISHNTTSHREPSAYRW